MTDPTQTHLNRKASFVDDYATNGRPDTLKILPDIRKQLRKAQEAQQENPTIEGAANVSWWRKKLDEYAARARARGS